MHAKADSGRKIGKLSPIDDPICHLPNDRKIDFRFILFAGWIFSGKRQHGPQLHGLLTGLATQLPDIWEGLIFAVLKVLSYDEKETIVCADGASQAAEASLLPHRFDICW